MKLWEHDDMMKPDETTWGHPSFKKETVVKYLIQDELHMIPARLSGSCSNSNKGFSSPGCASKSQMVHGTTLEWYHPLCD